jgi:NADH-quinone oxidoreductase subunit C
MIPINEILGAEAEVSPSDFEKTGFHWNVKTRPDTVQNAAKSLWNAGFFLEDLCAIDVEEGYEVIYHFASWQELCRVTVRTLVPHDRPEVPSISSVFSGASWHERECFDFHGVIFTDHPDLKPLLLPEDMDSHPLQKKKEDRRSLAKIFSPMDTAGPKARESAKTLKKSGENEG